LELDFPVVVKPALAAAYVNGHLRRASSFVCADKRELARAVEKADPTQPYLVQPLIAGVGEGLFGLCLGDAVLGWSAHRRVRMMNPAGSGSSACIATEVDPAAADRAKCLVVNAAWSGLFMIELLREPSGRQWFLELNGRLWGSLALARRTGYEYPAWAVAHALDREFRPPSVPSSQPVLCRHLGREIVHLLFVLRGPRSRAIENWPARWDTIRALCRRRRDECWYNWRPGAMGFFLDDTARTVLDQIRR
jgi:predicted ATP-grasp superfamily ATP-dependent carboligase